MIPDHIKESLNNIGKELSKILPEFYGKVSFNFYNGKCVHSNVEESIKNTDLKQGVEQ